MIRYRRGLIKRQLINAFPKKTPKDRQTLEKKIYHHLSDLLIEFLKGYTLSSAQLTKRWRVTNPEILHPHRDQCVIIVAGHTCNWEWGVSLNHQIAHHAISLYKPLHNKALNNYLVHCRAHGSNEMRSAHQTHRVILKNKHRRCAFTLVADQHPGATHHVHWMSFLNQDTGALMGPEFYAKRLNCPIYYTSIYKQRRGYYTTTLIPISVDPKSTAKGEITERFMKALEKDILRQPDLWLWTHNRWKLQQHNDEPNIAQTDTVN